MRLWDQLTLPVNHNPNILLRTQDLPPLLEENSCLYIFRRADLLRTRNRKGESPRLSAEGAYRVLTPAVLGEDLKPLTIR